MKKSAIIAALCLATVAAWGQRQRNYGDTMFLHLDSIYFAPDWVWDTWMALADTTPGSYNTYGGSCYISTMAGTIGDDENYHLRYNYTDHPIRIIGLATCVKSVALYADSVTNYLSDINWMQRQEYLAIYKATPDGPQFIDRLPISLDTPCRYIELPRYILGWYCLLDSKDSLEHYAMREYYFNKPFIIEDSFYVGGSDYSEWSMDYPGPNHIGLTATIYPGVYLIPPTWSDNTCNGRTTKVCRFFYFRPQQANIHRWYDWPAYPLSFALYEEIQPLLPGDTASCLKPTGLTLRYSNPEAGVVAIAWDSDPHHARWQVGIAPAGSDFNARAAIADATNHLNHSLTGLQPGTDYEIRVRALCNTDSGEVYSPWSDSLLVCLTPSAIAIATATTAHFTLHPNPATDQVTIAAEQIEEVKIINTLGQVVYTNNQVNGNELVINTTDLAAGLYIAQVRTAQGQSSQRFSVVK